MDGEGLVENQHYEFNLKKCFQPENLWEPLVLLGSPCRLPWSGRVLSHRDQHLLQGIAPGWTVWFASATLEMVWGSSFSKRMTLVNE